jgi:formylglycine-generating enzyme
MVSLGGFCIDATEVTNAQYAQFVAANVPFTGQPQRCGWNNAWNSEAFTTGQESLPVVGVDWCDASAFCAWSGKRLCGKIGGGAGPASEVTDPTKNQWFAACSGGNSSSSGYAYPYGNTYDPLACNGKDQTGDGLRPVGSLATCRGSTAPYSSLYDLSGNADEWEDGCNQKQGNGGNDACRVRSGNYLDDASYLLCSGAYARFKRNERYLSIGIRCCAD